VRIDGTTISEKIAAFFIDDGGHFEMPDPKIRPDHFILRRPGEEDRLIHVHATSHKAAYFKFKK
jgi:hypothetical protein